MSGIHVVTVDHTLHKRVLRWGNSYGIRLTKGEADALGLREDDAVDVGLRRCPPQVDWEALPRFSGPPDGSVRHDEILYAGWLSEQAARDEADDDAR